ncbi:di-trans,poly-cis-decaprenylcistransferase [Minwuia thermotolerans]|uniref:Isoprenyl transferase n=2 Tax=Minwuia thermotolerans TaxID=2056226 RepID=A0A2M9G1I7_9PROT|nr:di-trans,poly-cis-decaprenylcistransferase [Minwuia thermotolerans]
MANPEPRMESALPPRHVAIIMDGNRRWAKARGLPRLEGHRRGAEAVRATVRAAAEIGIEYLTLFAFSSENWRRPAEEVDDLMGLLRHYLRRELAELHRNDVRVRVVGDREGLARDIQALIQQAEETTRGNTRLDLIIAVNYGGQAEIVHAARRLAGQASRGEISAEDIDEDMIRAGLYAPDVPDPELLIRTSGEQRLSNFLLWQAAYAELVFDDVLWPDFDREALERALATYGCRDRRFGGHIG